MQEKTTNYNARLNNFALLHLIAAAGVVLGHTFSLMQLPPPGWLGDALQGQSVNVLFCISGYLVAGSFRRGKGLIDYYKKRFIRIYPPYIIALLVTVLVCFLLSTESGAVYWRGALSYLKHNAVFDTTYSLPGVFAENPHANSVNGSLWTLIYELALYAVLPVLLLLERKSKTLARRCILLVYLLAVACHVAGVYPSRIRIAIWILSGEQAVRLTAFFFAGVYCSCWPVEKLRSFCTEGRALLLVIAAGCLDRFYPAGMDTILIPYVTFTIALCSRPVMSQLFNRIDIAYELYLYGFLIQQIVINLVFVRMGQTWSVAAVFAVSMILDICAAFLYRGASRFVTRRLSLNRRNREEN